MGVNRDAVTFIGDVVFEDVLATFALGGKASILEFDDYCNCVAMGGRLAKCKLNKDYRNCLIINRHMGNNSAVDSCRNI